MYSERHPNHAAGPPIVARKAGATVVAIPCSQSLNSKAGPMPSSRRLSRHGGRGDLWSDFAVG